VDLLEAQPGNTRSDAMVCRMVLILNENLTVFSILLGLKGRAQRIVFA